MGKYLDSIGLSHFMSLIKQALAGKSDTGHTHSGYQLEGNYWTASKDGTSYWGMHFPNGTSNDWMRTPQSGIIPYASGGASSDCGTSTWPFKNIYGKTVYQNGTKVSVEGHTHSQYYDSGISRTANTVLAAPNGSAGAASFRKLVAADIPNLGVAKITPTATKSTYVGVARSTTKYTSAAAGNWNYCTYSDGTVHAWGIVSWTGATQTALGNWFYNSTTTYIQLPLGAKTIQSVIFGACLGGSGAFGSIAAPAGSASDWSYASSTATKYNIPFLVMSPASRGSGTYYFPIDVWFMKA